VHLIVHFASQACLGAAAQKKTRICIPDPLTHPHKDDSLAPSDFVIGAKYGQACHDGVYASAWARADNIIHHESCHTFINSSKVGYVDRKRVLHYRWGLLPTARWLCKIGKAINNTCPLCKGEDGGHYAITGCPRLSAAYTARHNDAGTEILEAIGKGQMGQCVVMSDVA
jgi:hypothetical protein